MTKKIRLIDEDETTEASEAKDQPVLDNAQVMKYLEAIDWKLWELLKVAKKVVGE